MAEIKSAIELAMEKTKDLLTDPREREAMAIKEVEDKVKAVLRRFSEEMIGYEDAARELVKIQADEGLKRNIIVDNLVDEFDVQKNNERLLPLFHSVGIELPKPVLREIEMLNRRFREELEAREAVVRERIRNNLAEAGIRGDGIEPNLSVWREWSEEAELVGKVFTARMKELKDSIRSKNRAP